MGSYSYGMLGTRLQTILQVYCLLFYLCTRCLSCVASMWILVLQESNQMNLSETDTWINVFEGQAILLINRHTSTQHLIKLTYLSCKVKSESWMIFFFLHPPAENSTSTRQLALCFEWTKCLRFNFVLITSLSHDLGSGLPNTSRPHQRNHYT